MLPRIQSLWLRVRRFFSRSEWELRRLGLKVSTDAPHSHGLLLIQIDGLARAQFERAISRGRMPFLKRLLRRQDYRLHTFYPGLPASTPAVQAELYYGIKCAVPAFSFLDRRAGEIGMMMHPDRAKAIEADLQAQATGLLKGGSSWSNIYTGGADQAESHFCGASIGFGDMWRTGKLRTIATFAFLHFPAFLRLAGLLILEVLVGLRDLGKGVWHGHSLWREGVFLVARVFVCVGLREMVTLGGSIDVARGLPVVHVNFLGYDEQSHRRGPDSAFAHWALRGIDRAVKYLYRAARRSGRRDYEIWIFSDHGQTRARQFDSKVDGGLEGVVRKHWPNQDALKSAPRPRAQRRPSPGHWLGGPRAEKRESMHRAESRLTAFEKEEFAVAAMGPVGHIYFGRTLGQDETRRLAALLVRDGVPGILLRREDGGVDWLHAEGEQILPAQAEGLPFDDRWQREVAEDLAALARNPHAGDLVALGWGPDGQSWTFAQENGSHAGPSPQELQGFALLPAGLRLPEGTEEFIRPGALRSAALHFLGRSEAAANQPSKSKRLKPAAAAPLRVVTYNVHSCRGCDGRISPRRVARVLEQIDADLIALQELDAGRNRSRSEDQLALIAESLGMHAYFCPAVTRGSEKYGHGVLAREPMELVRRGLLPHGGRHRAEPREAVWLSFLWEGREVQLLSTHLGLGSAEQAAQVADLLAPTWLGGIGTERPVVLCGDFNLPPGSRSYRLIASRLRDVQAHAPNHTALKTFPSLWPVRRIDHVFVSSHFDVLKVAVPRNDLTRVTSDHLPLVVDLTLQTLAVASDTAQSGAENPAVTAGV